MKIKLLTVLILLFCAAATTKAQVRIPGPGGRIVAVNLPTFVNETNKNSTLTGQVTTQVSGTTTCVSYGYCIPFADYTLSGNLGVLFYQYNHASTAVTATASDDKSDTWTCGSAGSQVQVGSGYWVNYCYFPNLTAGAHVVTLVFGTTTVTQVEATLEQFYNVATSTPLDASSIVAGTSSSTANGASVTTTQANDLVIEYVSRVGTPAVTSFTAGSGYTLGTTNILDGAATEYGVVSGTGSTTPSMTMASSSTYGEVALAFKAASAGTAPTGWYTEKLMSWSYLSASAGNRSFQFPTTGNLLVSTNSCNAVQPTSITDGTNTWTSAGTLFAGSGNNAIEFYVANASANSSGALTVNASTVTGDCTYNFYSFKGAPSSPTVVRTSFDDNHSGSSVSWTSGVALDTWVAQGINYSSNNVLQVGRFLPFPTTGLSIAVGGEFSNTSLGVNSPSACIGDMSTQGGEPLSSPTGWPVDQNNPYAHCFFTGSAGQTPIAWNLTSTTTDPNGHSGDIVSFYGSGATSVVDANYLQGTSATYLENTSVPATTSGNLFVVAVGVYNSTARTITKVCLGGDSTCSSGTQLTQLTGATSTGSGHGATSIWYTLTAPSGATQLDVVASGSAANIEAAYYEVNKYSGSWATDGGSQTTNGTGSGTTDSGPSITTTGSVDFCAANIGVSNVIKASPLSGNEYLYGATIFSNTSDAAASLLTTSASAHQPKWLDGGSGNSFSSSQGCFK